MIFTLSPAPGVAVASVAVVVVVLVEFDDPVDSLPEPVVVVVPPVVVVVVIGSVGRVTVVGGVTVGTVVVMQPTIGRQTSFGAARTALENAPC